MTTDTPNLAAQLSDLQNRVEALEDAIAAFGDARVAAAVKKAERDRATGEFGTDAISVPEAVERYRHKRFGT